jgi:hypothetical protein
MIALLPDAVGRLEQGTVAVAPEEHLYESIVRAITTPAKPSEAQATEERPKEEKPDWEFATDFEDVALSKDGDLFLITSHSQSKSGKRKEKRMRLIRLKVDPATGKPDPATEVEIGLVGRLPDSLKGALELKPGSMDEKGEIYTPGFNIEGLACTTDGDLLVGLRSPVDKEHRAIVLRIKGAGTDSPTVTEEALLALNPKLSDDAKAKGLARGIRGMCFDAIAGGYWLIAGLAADHDPEAFPDKPLPKNEWSLWFWNGKDKLTEYTPAELQLGDDMPNPEAICAIPKAGDKPHRLLLISDDDKKPEGAKNGESRFAIIPVPLPKAPTSVSPAPTDAPSEAFPNLPKGKG